MASVGKPNSYTIQSIRSWSVVLKMWNQQERKERKRKKNYASSKKLLTSIKEKGPLVKKSPFTRKEESNQWGSGGLRADKPADLSWLVWRWECSKNVWSKQAYEHSAQNEHGAWEQVSFVNQGRDSSEQPKCEE